MEGVRQSSMFGSEQKENARECQRANQQGASTEAAAGPRRLWKGEREDRRLPRD